MTNTTIEQRSATKLNYSAGTEKLAVYRREIADLRQKIRTVQADTEPQVVQDYAFATPVGPRKLSDLFGEKDDLILIHNMGKACPNCTLWADGFNGIFHHLADRAAFVVSSPDAPAVQKEFAMSRGWRFPMVSHEGTSFAADMGYRNEKGGWRPGISVFRRDGGRILRVTNTGFQPLDDFCPLWHMFDLLAQGRAEWSPKFTYL